MPLLTSLSNAAAKAYGMFAAALKPTYYAANVLWPSTAYIMSGDIAVSTNGSVMTASSRNPSSNRDEIQEISNEGVSQWIMECTSTNGTYTKPTVCYGPTSRWSAHTLVTVVSPQQLTALTRKVSATGSTLWQRTLTPGSGEYAESGVLLYEYSDGSILNVGWAYRSSNSYILFVKYDASGNLLFQKWSKNVVYSAGQRTGACVDSAGNIYTISEGYSGPTTIYKYEPTMTAAPMYVQLGTSTGNTGTDCVAVDSSGNIYGFTYTGATALPTLVKTNSSGVVQWQKTISYGGGGNYRNGLALDAQQNIYLYGDSTVIKFDPSGTVIWQRAYTSASGYGSDGQFAIDNVMNTLVLNKTISNVYNTGFARFPLDGSKTGTYTTGATTWTWAAASLTVANASLSISTGTGVAATTATWTAGTGPTLSIAAGSPTTVSITTIS